MLEAVTPGGLARVAEFVLGSDGTGAGGSGGSSDGGLKEGVREAIAALPQMATSSSKEASGKSEGGDGEKNGKSIGWQRNASGERKRKEREALGIGQHLRFADIPPDVRTEAWQRYEAERAFLDEELRRHGSRTFPPKNDWAGTDAEGDPPP